MANDPHWKLPIVPGFALSSPDFDADGDLPLWAASGIAGTPGGEDRSPELVWSGLPSETKSLVVTCFDPDAPTSSGWWHWAVCNLPATLTGLPRNAGDPDAGLLPEGALTLPNDIRLARYQGAAPPAGHGPHRYYFTVTALKVPAIEIGPESTPALLAFLIREHAIARASIVGIRETL